MLALDDLDSFYGRSQILHGVGLHVAQGQLHAIVGRNGAGKSTLLRSIMKLTDRVTGGQLLEGRSLGADSYLRARAGLGYVPQGRQIFPDFTIRENILVGGFAARSGKRRIPDIVAELFPYLIQNLDRLGGVLSGGQQQQLAIARALAMEPDVLLLDEPTEGIQPNIVEQIEGAITRLNRELGLTVVLVEQNIRFIRAAADHFTMLENGRSVASGPIGGLTDDLITKHMTV
jgi:urea transport system ATP-binding protein